MENYNSARLDGFPCEEAKLMHDYDLADRYSWDGGSALRLVKVQMVMKYREVTDKIIRAINERIRETEDIDRAERLVTASKDEATSDSSEVDKSSGSEKLADIEEDEQSLDLMKDKEIDYLDVIMPNLALNLPKIDADGNSKKVQFSLTKPGGAAAQGANPVYAKDTDVLVPNVHSESSHVIRTEEAIVKTTFKSEVSFETAYSGVSIRKVIMEERNVYCGAYNVMVLTGQFDQHRVCDTDGNRLIVIGSKDRKLRFIDTETGHEHKRMTKGESKDDELPIITGHAGSVRCVRIMEKQGVVLSGSYDTSIRMWSIKTGHCLKIFRGHRDTVLCMRVVGELLISGSKDRSCKVWDMQTGKCQRSYRHRYPVLSVAMSTDVVISGCEGGKVKVWDLKSGNLIKVLSGHHEAITAIQFDRWHIVTSGRDGYALVWSALGDHNRCLSALRHPREVLCLEFMYLRCITGCGDGRIRIWNILTGQCCRIMRGNSVSDPILSIIAIGDRITINTAVNLLVLNFEKVNWDYNLPDDKVPPLVQYGHYSDAPVRQQPYPYIRAQRMKKAGASNTKILNKGVEEDNGAGAKPPTSQISIKAAQLPHSAKSLSAKSLSSARFIQTIPESGYETGSLASRELRGMKSASYVGHVDSARRLQSLSAHSKPPLPKSRPQTSKSAASAHSVTIVEDVAEHEYEDEWREPLLIKRRISWAFEEPILPKTKGISLSETKALLRSQMRMKSESVVPPDFIYLTVNAIQSSLKPTETNENTEKNLRDARKMLINTRRDRPSSSPSKIDPRTRVPVEELDLSMFRERQEEEAMSEFSDWKSIKTTKSKESEPPLPDKEVYSTKCQVKPLRTCPKVSVHPKRIRTSLPRARVIRPISASVQRREPPEESRHDRPVTAPNMRARPDTASSIPSQIAASLPGAQPGSAKRQVQTTGNTANIVPMLMYPPDMREKLIEKLKEKRQQRNDDLLESASEMGRGKVSQYNDPMRSHIKFELRTHNQEKDYITHVEKQHSVQRKREEAMMERKKKILWMAKAKGQNIPRTQSAPVI